MARQVFILTLLLVAIVGVAMAGEAPTSSPESSPAPSSSPAASPKSSPPPKSSPSPTTSSPIASPPTMEEEISSPPAPAPESPFFGFGPPADGPAVVVSDAPAPTPSAPAPPADQTKTNGASALGVSALVAALAGFFAF